MLSLLLTLLPTALPSTVLPPTSAPLAELHTQPSLDDVQDDRPQIEALLKQLLKHTKKRGDEDAQAAQIIERLGTEFKRSGPKDKKAIIAEITRAMRVKRPTARDGTRVRQLFLVGAKTLGNLAPDSVDSLVRLASDRNHKEDYAVRGAILTALGKTKDKKGVRVLTKELDEFQARVQASAADALGQFAHLDHKNRKAIFEDLLKLLMSAQAANQSDPNGMTSSDRWRRVSGPCQRSMAKLSGANAGSPNNWQRWWNKNKNRNWDKR